MSAVLGHDVHGPEQAPVVVLGTSIGTTRTLWDQQLPALAERFRVVRYRLAVVCSTAHVPSSQTWLERAATVRADWMTAVADPVVARWFRPASARSAKAAAVLQDLLAVPAERYAGCCDAIAGMDLRADLARVTAPTVVVAGDRDQATPVATSAEVVERIVAGGGAARLEVVEDAAHLACVEQPGRVTSALLQHFGAGPSAAPGSTTGG